MTCKSLGLQSYPDYQRLSKVFKGEFKSNLDRLSDRISGPFLMSDEIIVPDIILTHCVGWTYVALFTSDNEKSHAFLKSLRSRPAYKKALTKVAA